MSQLPFGGDWTQEKLKRIEKYLRAYTTIMSKKPFRYAYIDAFAGTGYQQYKREENEQELMFPELVGDEPTEFRDGSARIALQVQPRFTKYIFVEKDENRFNELSKLREEYPNLGPDIILVNADANAYLADLCTNYNWRKNRAVLFLDPFGMQVTWNTIEAIASTKAIDLWYLFPLGMGVNRLLKKDGQISEVMRQKLNSIFCAEDWYDAFYQTYTQKDLFGEHTETIKVGDFELISDYFVKRLKTVFAGVAENPLALFNSKRNPLYLLCFASANPIGAPIAIEIAQHILSH